MYSTPGIQRKPFEIFLQLRKNTLTLDPNIQRTAFIQSELKRIPLTLTDKYDSKQYIGKYKQYRGVNIAYIKQYALFSRDRNCLYLAVYSIFGASLLLILSNIQYFRGIDTVYIKQD